MNEIILVDTSAWIALFDDGDEHHEKILEWFEFIKDYPLLILWPITYETLRTRFVRRPNWLMGFQEIIRRARVTFLNDDLYREEVFARAIDSIQQKQRPLSMVDILCRFVLEDKSIKISYLMTTNRGDFVDVCSPRGIEIIPL